MDSSKQANQDGFERRYRQIIEQVEDYAIFTLDTEGRILTWNGGAERVLGFSEEEALGQLGRLIFTPEDREQGVPQREYETARRDGKANDERWHMRKDGSRFYANGILTALYDNGNSTVLPRSCATSPGSGKPRRSGSAWLRNSSSSTRR